MEQVRKAYFVNANGTVGVVISDELKRKIEAEVIALLIENQDECIAYDWTLNDTYKEDGKQVIIKYPSDFWKDERERIENLVGFNSLNINKCLFTDCENKDEVKELCQKVALGEIVPMERDA